MIVKEGTVGVTIFGRISGSCFIGGKCYAGRALVFNFFVEILFWPIVPLMNKCDLDLYILLLTLHCKHTASKNEDITQWRNFLV